MRSLFGSDMWSPAPFLGQVRLAQATPTMEEAVKDLCQIVHELIAACNGGNRGEINRWGRSLMQNLASYSRRLNTNPYDIYFKMKDECIDPIYEGNEACWHEVRRWFTDAHNRWEKERDARRQETSQVPTPGLTPTPTPGLTPTPSEAVSQLPETASEPARLFSEVPGLPEPIATPGPTPTPAPVSTPTTMMTPRTTAPAPIPTTDWSAQAQPISTQYSWGGEQAWQQAEQAAAACPPGQFWDGRQCRGAIGAMPSIPGGLAPTGAVTPTTAIPVGDYGGAAVAQMTGKRYRVVNGWPG